MSPACRCSISAAVKASTRGCCACAAPIALEADVLGTIEHLASRLAATLERRGEGARLLQAALFRTDGKVFRIEVGTAEPLRDPFRIRRLFADPAIAYIHAHNAIRGCFAAAVERA